MSTYSNEEALKTSQCPHRCELYHKDLQAFKQKLEKKEIFTSNVKDRLQVSVYLENIANK